MERVNGVTLFEELLQTLREGLHPQQFVQLVVIAVAVVAAALMARWLRARGSARLRKTKQAGMRLDALRFSVDGVRRLAFPVLANLFLAAGWLLMRATGWAYRPADVQLIRLAFTLLVAMAIIRLLVYVLRRTFRRAAWIGVFERAIVFVIWSLAALHIIGVLDEIVLTLESVKFPLGKLTISVWSLLVAAVSVVLTVLVALWTGSAIESRLMTTTSLAPNSRVALSRIFKALLLVVAVMIALTLVGIDLTVLSVFGGALGVGLGLGLQRVASNYVAGFIILLDRSLTIGDMITVDKFNGSVAEINTRYTVIKAIDGTETIVPNEMLMSTPVINHSYSDRKVRVALKLSVGYSSDLDQAMKILVDAALAHERVVTDPAPAAFLSEFGADGLDLELGFWITDPEKGTLAVRSDIGRKVLLDFRAAGIEIPFPQRDLRITAIPAEWPGFNSVSLNQAAEPKD